MKTRIGFVSNSSTSSFCIFGTELDWYSLDDEAREMIRKKYDIIEDDDYCYVGKLISDADDSDGHTFTPITRCGPNHLEEVAKELKDLFGKKIKIGFHAGIYAC